MSLDPSFAASASSVKGRGREEEVRSPSPRIVRFPYEFLPLVRSSSTDLAARNPVEGRKEKVVHDGFGASADWWSCSARGKREEKKETCARHVRIADDGEREKKKGYPEVPFSMSNLFSPSLPVHGEEGKKKKGEPVVSTTVVV